MSRDPTYKPGMDKNESTNATRGEKAPTLMISNYALHKMKEIGIKENYKRLSLRVALVRTHCMRGRGYTYSFALQAPNKEEDSLILQEDEIDVYAPKSDIVRLSGLQIDYVETLQHEGFTVDNPNAKAKCPCGHHDIFE